MSFDDPAVRPLLELEGLREWRPGRTSGYAPARGGRRPARLLRPTAIRLELRRRRRLRRRDGSSRASTVVDARLRSGSTAAPTSSSSWRSPVGAPASEVGVRRRATPTCARQLATWCRQQGHRWREPAADGDGDRGRRRRAGPAAGRPLGRRRARRRRRPARRRRWPPTPPPAWGLAARGAPIEPGGPAPAFRLDRPRRGVDRPRATPLRPGGRRPVGPGDGRSTGTRRSPTDRRRRGRRRPGDDVPGRERGGGAGRAGPVPRPGAPALPRDPAGAGRHRRRRGPPHRGLHPAGRRCAGQRAARCRPSAAGPRCRRCSTSPTSPSPRSCCR